MDALSPLLRLFSLHASTFYAGPLCAVAEFDDDPHQSHFHLVLKGPITILDQQGQRQELSEPTLIFLPRPHWHRLLVDERDGAHVVCANIKFGTEGSNPVTDSLPHLVCMPLDHLPGTQALMALMQDEAFSEQMGRRAALDRLCEMLLIHVLRHCMANGSINRGALAGLSDARLQKVLQSIHQAPTHKWDLVDMASIAGMSRSRFADHFKAVIGQTPADYLVSWRVALAQKLLRAGRPVKSVADEVGYAGATAFSKAFSRKTGMAPAQWLKALSSDQVDLD